MKNKLVIYGLFCTVLLGCSKPDYSKHTSIKFLDQHRLYSPIVQGESLQMTYQFENTGEVPLIIKELQTSCGCIVSDFSAFAVGSGNLGYVNLKYDSKMNIGFVKHHVTIIANVDSTLTKNITFQLNVVPNSHHIKDYEEVFFSDSELDEYAHLYKPIKNGKVIYKK